MQSQGVRRGTPDADSMDKWVAKPMGYSLFKHELAPTPIHWVETSGNMVWSKYHEQVCPDTSHYDSSLRSQLHPADARHPR
jgi:hypothetical protein